MKTAIPIACCLTALAVVGAWVALKEGGSQAPLPSTNGNAPPALVFYTNPGATTPQLPFWAAKAAGHLDDIFTIEVRTWKNVVDLQGALLAGKGDLWLGHLEGFARARRMGAPVRILAVSGWRKMNIVSTDPAIRSLEDLAGTVLPYAPVGSPGVPVLEFLLGTRKDDIQLRPHEPKQLALLMLQGKARSALLPEPLVTTLLRKVDGLRVVENLEELYGRQTGGLPRMPLAGFAVNDAFLARHPARVSQLLACLTAAAGALAISPDAAAAAMPEMFTPFVSRDIVRESLTRDVILVEPASKVAEEIRQFLALVAPDALAEEEPGGARQLPPGLLVP
ncbi:MAG: ABC transporter substrate-binding protein [Lentisphaerae bacterium]|jgi:NitT/TauT family transport system substrate-binding protein|nr:ABC transporter substrate-binding protein [Lentisphaerota bacterium]MBT4823060.1 ABC transporter substrate-binding protein [Lentisphaerota bacterium]MBT5610577.1 ABC transporter substrate-binding protein [Lentisphaerota bacterium]MBT7060171.1 ABC transporter substrate-binding protein [Lentisphaerota bacterium]MBT7844136.1 ABC transporter substrate-binding protein [Lentisphaerota bacterium]